MIFAGSKVWSQWTALRSISCLLFLVLIWTGPVRAEIVSVGRQYAYSANNLDNKSSSRVIALEQAKRLLFADVGTEFQKEEAVQKLGLTENQVAAAGLCLLRPVLIEEKWDGKIYYLKLEVRIDQDEFLRLLAAVKNDAKKLADFDWALQKTGDLLKELGKLGRDNQGIQASRRKAELKVSGTRISDYQDAIKKLSSMDWFEKGLHFQSAQNTDEALKAFSSAIKTVPTFLRALRNRGTIYADLGRYKDSITDFSGVIDLVPDSAEVYLDRGAVYHRWGKYLMALKDFDRYIQLKPNQAEAYVVRAATYHQMGNYPMAIKDFDKVIELNPHYPDAYSMRGSSYFRLGEYRQAVDNYSKALELKQDNSQTFFDRGSAYYRLGSFEEAIKDFDKAIDLNRKYAEAYALRGATYGSLGNYFRAEEDLKAAARLGDSDAQAFLKTKGITWE